MRDVGTPEAAAVEVVELKQCITCIHADGSCPDYEPDMRDCMWCANYSDVEANLPPAKPDEGNCHDLMREHEEHLRELERIPW